MNEVELISKADHNEKNYFVKSIVRSMRLNIAYALSLGMKRPRYKRYEHT
jgi:hypothetical protein